MNFKLDPSSGFADSYLDIEFYVTYNKSPKTVLTIYNETSNEQLNILGVSSGYILEENKVIINDASKIYGHINIFNEDKMNKKFSLFGNVKITCKLKHFDDEDNYIEEEKKTIVFYNESQSLDAEVIPFDLILHQSEINVDNNEPLKIELISGLERGYEICIKSLDNKSACHLEISSKIGKVDIQVPVEILLHDLGLQNGYSKKKFQLYYVKFQGTTYSRIANRKYIPITNSVLTFSGSHSITPMPQSRLDPAKRRMGYSKFILSDRYLVMCPKEFSGFSRKMEFSNEKLMDLTMMMNEGQHMESIVRQMKQFSEAESKDADNIKKTQRTVQRSKVERPKISMNQIQMLKGVAGVYEPISQINTAIQIQNIETFATAQNSQSSGGCAPCSRKRQINA